jgi:hypothetical protein
MMLLVEEPNSEALLAASASFTGDAEGTRLGANDGAEVSGLPVGPGEGFSVGTSLGEYV